MDSLSINTNVVSEPPVAAVQAKEEPAETPLEALASICVILAIGMFVFAVRLPEL